MTLANDCMDAGGRVTKGAVAEHGKTAKVRTSKLGMIRLFSRNQEELSRRRGARGERTRIALLALRRRAAARVFRLRSEMPFAAVEFPVAERCPRDSTQ
jgi:hypothetical protein